MNRNGDQKSRSCETAQFRALFLGEALLVRVCCAVVTPLPCSFDLHLLDLQQRHCAIQWKLAVCKAGSFCTSTRVTSCHIYTTPALGLFGTACI